MPKNPWTPWHEIVSLRDDLRSGELPVVQDLADPDLLVEVEATAVV